MKAGELKKCLEEIPDDYTLYTEEGELQTVRVIHQPKEVLVVHDYAEYAGLKNKEAVYGL